MANRRGQSAWHRFLAEHQRALPRDATPQERGRATQRAAAQWRARKGGAAVNPIEGTADYLKVAGVAALAFVALCVLGGKLAELPPASPPERR